MPHGGLIRCLAGGMPTLAWPWSSIALPRPWPPNIGWPCHPVGGMLSLAKACTSVLCTSRLLGRRDALGQKPAGVRAVAGGHVLNRPRSDLASAVLAAFGAQVEKPVGLADEVEVVLDHEQAVPGVDQAVECSAPA